MTIDVLVACMNQQDLKIIDSLNLETNSTIINQCQTDSEEELLFENNTVQFINSSDRGLSKSRNLAISKSRGDICVICDDDIRLINGYNDIILKAYQDNPEADIIVFQLLKNNNEPYKKYSKRKKNVNYFSALKISSCEISFKKESIIKNKLFFDENFGAGSKNNCPGEENLFLKSALEANLRIVYLPYIIGRLNDSDSTWFRGFDSRYFYFRGVFSRVYFGLFLGAIYVVYFILKNINLFGYTKLCLALKNSFRGLFGVNIKL